MLQFMWDAVRLGLVAAGIYGALAEPLVLGSWFNVKIAAALMALLVTLDAMRSTVQYTRAFWRAAALLGAISVVTGSQSWRPVLVVLAVGATMSSLRLLVPTLRRVRIRLEEERA